MKNENSHHTANELFWTSDEDDAKDSSVTTTTQRSSRRDLYKPTSAKTSKKTNGDNGTDKLPSPPLDLDGSIPPAEFKVGDCVMLFDTNHPLPHRIDRGIVAAVDYRAAGAEGNAGLSNCNRNNLPYAWRYQIASFTLHSDYEKRKHYKMSVDQAREYESKKRLKKPKLYWGGYEGAGKKGDGREWEGVEFKVGTWFEECDVDLAEEMEAWKTNYEGYSFCKRVGLKGDEGMSKKKGKKGKEAKESRESESTGTELGGL
jgi:hypothetical protein